MPFFWYFERMKEHLKTIGEPHVLKAKLKDGTIVNYTLETVDSKMPSGWEDIRFIGEGEFHEKADD